MNLSPHATASHWSAKYVGRDWSDAFNCWHLVQAVQREVFGRVLAPLPIGTQEDQTAALLTVTQGWQRVSGPAIEGDVITMLCDLGPHVGVVVDPDRVLHNVGANKDGVPWGSVRINTNTELGVLVYGRLRLWRAV